MNKDKEELEKLSRSWSIALYTLLGIWVICMLILILPWKALFGLMLLAIVILIAAFSGDDISRTRP
jgi:hypothetical protein